MAETKGFAKDAVLLAALRMRSLALAFHGSEQRLVTKLKPQRPVKRREKVGAQA